MHAVLSTNSPDHKCDFVITTSYQRTVSHSHFQCLIVTVQGKMVLRVNFLDFVISNNFVTITIRESKTIVIFYQKTSNY